MFYKEYLKTDTWKEKKDAVIQRSRDNKALGIRDAPYGVCEKCGKIIRRKKD